MNQVGELCALLAAFVWSFSVILFKRSEVISPLGLNLFKNIVAIAILVLLLPILGVSVSWDRPSAEWLSLIASGVLGIGLADTLFFMALRRLGPALLAVVECVYTPLMVVLAMLFLGERAGLGFAIGASLVVSGVLLSNVEPGAVSAARSPSERRDRGLGMLYGLLAIGCLAGGIFLVRPLLAVGNVFEISLVRLCAGVLGQLVWIAGHPRPGEAFLPFRPSPAWRTLIPASVLSSTVAMVLWLLGFKYAEASVAVVLNQMSTFFTLGLARVMLGEPLGRGRILGASFAALGALMVLLGRPG